MDFKTRYKYNPKTDLLGKGGFARVYKANDVLLDREVAVKVFSVQDGGHYTVLEEIKKVIRYEHPNLLRYYDVALLENTNAFGETEELQVGIMEYANAGDLKTFAQKNPGSPLLFKFLQQVLQGLAFLHQNGIIHRDLKPQNILLTEKNGELTAKISDFGISKNMDTGTNSASVAIGTIEYMAPEQFSPNKYGIGGKISTNLDLWSFGIMVHELITDRPPFGQRSGSITAEQIMNSILSAELPADIEKLSNPYKAIIKKCLVADAKLRIRSAAELISYFEGKQDTEAKNELETQVLSNYANWSAAHDMNDRETELLNVNSDAETQVLERPGASTTGSTSNAGAAAHISNQGSVGEDADIPASKWRNLLIGGLTAVVLCIGLLFLFRKENPPTQETKIVKTPRLGVEKSLRKPPPIVKSDKEIVEKKVVDTEKMPPLSSQLEMTKPVAKNTITINKNVKERIYDYYSFPGASIRSKNFLNEAGYLDKDEIYKYIWNTYKVSRYQCTCRCQYMCKYIIEKDGSVSNIICTEFNSSNVENSCTKTLKNICIKTLAMIKYKPIYLKGEAVRYKEEFDFLFENTNFGKDY